MIEILIVIAVVKGFCGTAAKKGRSKVAWGIIGTFSYYLPILIVSFLILPLMLEAGLLEFINEKNYFFIGIAINLLTGILCCFMAYMLLKSLPSVQKFDPINDKYHGGNVMPNDDATENPYRPYT